MGPSHFQLRLHTANRCGRCEAERGTAWGRRGCGTMGLGLIGLGLVGLGLMGLWCHRVGADGAMEPWG